ncbi:MAG TPA: chemotaxis protein CheR [Planctomycetaceae bacterium]|nr:chemotaxis protein CheR [Rubinisphaera sp.]HCS54621.1 chemotaxis protein CheR [Planctomycetaceae bacterium]|tara:strand:+ start:16064 stop:20194 length:4131 start_codon:yes stop_codon:yes gene_type:complete
MCPVKPSGEFQQKDGEDSPELRISGKEDQTPEANPEIVDSLPYQGTKQEFPIVGVGASAGGLEALEAFFDHMSPDSGLAFVVVQHLSPDFKSVMDELLARHTKIQIHRVTDGMQVEPNSIYLIPPKKEMIISDGKLLLSDKDPKSGLTLPIDIFFRSLAQDAGSRAIAVILSGTGSDGSQGIQDIHENGGFVIAQDLESAKFDGMPKSANATGVVDLILPPERMGAALSSYIQQPGSKNLTDFKPVEPALLKGFDAIFQLLRKHYDIDFSYYKQSTVTRRVQRRLLMHQITDLDEYVTRLRDDSSELNSLYKDLLIGVTKFFRDPEAFDLIDQNVLPEILANHREQDELRVWVAGCATGEEAYSLAILIREHMEEMAKPLDVKIFATDVHPTSLETASVGIYSEESLSEVSSERLEKYFKQVKTGFQVSQDLRQMIVFAPHNIIKDAPFTKIDLITCRNMLIYLEPPAQKKAISLFHFALNTRGVMFMGPSESPGELADEFDVIDERWKVYRKRRDKRLPVEMRLPLSAGYASSRIPRMGLSQPHAPANGALLRAYDELLKEYAPPTLLINNSRELVQSFSGASKYIKLSDGRPSTDIFDLLLPDLKIPLTTAVQQVVKNQKSVTFKGVRVTHETTEELLRLTVRPLQARSGDEQQFLVTLEPMEKPKALVKENDDALNMDLDQASKEQLLALESELLYTKENLQSTVEEMETSNEELQATNEELVASNEELQSTNEELHSVNEELYTVNAEYQKKIAELMELTADMDNLLHSTEVGVIFLDRELCIRKYTPKIGETFHLLPMDIGRRVDSFAHNIDHPNLVNDLKRVLIEQTPFEIEVHGGDSQTFLMRILPYRSKNKVDGVVLTLIEISRLKQAESELKLMSKVFQDGADPIILEDLDGQIVDLNAEAEKIYGWSRAELLGQSFKKLVPQDEQIRAKEWRMRCIEKLGLRNIETVKHDIKGNTFPVLLTLSLLTDQNGKPAFIASIAKDITDRKLAEDKARDAVRKRDQFLAMLSHELRNPLGAALNATYLLDGADEKVLSKPLLEACKVIQRQTLQVARLLDDLLDVSRVTQGKIEIRKQIVDMTQLIEDTLQAVRPHIDALNHKLTVEVSSQPVIVEGDPSRLLQIQENLLANAAKYTPEGGHIRLSLAKEDGEAILRVGDNGNGIPPHMLEKIFELFVQSDETLDRSQGGMGLGLTLVKDIVELHGGNVSAHSNGAGKGSEFVVRLPLAKDSQVPVLSLPVKNDANSSDQKNIVLVEDNDDNRAMLKTLLRLKGHLVSTAANGSQGVDVILHQLPDVAIVDIGLPGISGYEVAKKVRAELGNQVYLIALTGYGCAEDREATTQAGFDTHLVKPLDPVELDRVLNSISKSDR